MKYPKKYANYVVYYLACLGVLLVSVLCSRNATLKQAFKDQFFIGTALNVHQIFGQDESVAKIIDEQFNSITCENALKWEFVHPNPDKYDFVPSDRFVTMGEQNNMFIIGHVLVWHQQIPAWVFQNTAGELTNRETLIQVLRDHIFTVVGRYKGRIDGWDVINEAVDDKGYLRNSRWLDIIGEEYIQKAFEFAHEADPHAELYYNDYSLFEPAKRDGVVKLVQNLQSKGIQIDGIGMQGHWGLDYPSLKELENSILTFSRLGVKVMITELDMDVLPSAWKQRGADISLDFELQKALNPYTMGLPDSMQSRQVERYKDIFKIFHKYHEYISRVTFWGIHDGQSWLNNWPIRKRTSYPLLFNRQYQPKPAFHAVIQTARSERKD